MPPIDNRIAAKKCGKNPGSHAQVHARQFLAYSVNVKCAGAHSFELFRNEQELDAQSRAAHFLDDLIREFILGIEFQEFLFRQMEQP